jgi:hypothetical protein
MLFKAVSSGSWSRCGPAGAAGSLTTALVWVAAQPRSQTRAAVRAHFDRELSMTAVGQRLAEVYEDLILRA